jgi:tRNA pseudouridine38-40 synthase
MTRAFELAYDGTAYAGWQVQENARTIQGVIEDCLEKVVKRRVRVTYAGRTDAGVHAIGQVIAFSSESSMTGEQFVRGLNSLLPLDIRIMRALEVEPTFHPRYDARARWYRYLIWNGKELVPFFRHYAFWLSRDLDISLISGYCERIVGEHDFTSFATLTPGENPVRTITSCEVRRRKGFVVFDIVANSFLRKMVRTIVGTFLRLEQEGASPECVEEILGRADREAAGETAFPGGLYLARVFYDGR